MTETANMYGIVRLSGQRDEIVDAINLIQR
jgi:hypothetical protein